MLNSDAILVLLFSYLHTLCCPFSGFPFVFGLFSRYGGDFQATFFLLFIFQLFILQSIYLELGHHNIITTLRMQW